MRRRGNSFRNYVRRTVRLYFRAAGMRSIFCHVIAHSTHVAAAGFFFRRKLGDGKYAGHGRSCEKPDKKECRCEFGEGFQQSEFTPSKCAVQIVNHARGLTMISQFAFAIREWRMIAEKELKVRLESRQRSGRKPD